ncbi:MAG: PAS domain S-box protein [Bacteroidia bacterium]
MKNSGKELDQVYKLLFESAGEALFVVNTKGIIQLMNVRACEMFGYEESELVGQPLEILLPESDRKAHVKHRKDYNEAPRRRSMGMGMDLRGIRKDGKQLPIEVSLNYFESGGEMFIMSLVTDISERRKVEESVRKLNEELENKVNSRTKELKESQQLYQVIARNFPAGTINVFDRKLNYVFVEGMELFKYGVTSEKLVGTSYLDRVSEEIREEIKTKLLEVFAGKNATFEIQFKGRFYSMNAVALNNSEGKIEQILLVEQNITAQKTAEEDVKTALIKEQELNQLKSRFVSMASHEFRTPLSTILSSTALIEAYLEPEKFNFETIKNKTDKHLKRIKSSVGNLTNILNDFLSLDKLELGKIQPQSIEFNIKQFLIELTEEIQTTLKSGQKINYSHTSEVVDVFLDGQMLRNIVINLLSNASKYSPEESTIKLTSNIERNNLIIMITDQGIGIPEVEQEKIFERFFRAKNVTNIQGTGLGLNIVKRYVDLMKGEISFSSKEGEGTTFKLIIKIKK